MAQGIDFLQAKKQKTLAQAKAARSLKLGSLIFLIVYCLLTAGIFVYWLRLDQANQKINQEIVLRKQKIQELKKVESLQVFLKQRLTSLAKIIFQKGPNYSQIILYFEEISPDGLVLSGIDFKKKEIVVSGEAVNILALSEFLEALKQKQPIDTIFSEIILSSMSRNETGNYQFGLLIKTNGKSGTTESI